MSSLKDTLGALPVEDQNVLMAALQTISGKRLAAPRDFVTEEDVKRADAMLLALLTLWAERHKHEAA